MASAYEITDSGANTASSAHKFGNVSLGGPKTFGTGASTSMGNIWQSVAVLAAVFIGGLVALRMLKPRTKGKK